MPSKDEIHCRRGSIDSKARINRKNEQLKPIEIRRMIMAHFHNHFLQKSGGIRDWHRRSTIAKWYELEKVEETDGLRLLTSLLKVVSQFVDNREQLVEVYVLALHRSDRMHLISMPTFLQTLTYLRDSGILVSAPGLSEHSHDLRQKLLKSFIHETKHFRETHPRCYYQVTGPH